MLSLLALFLKEKLLYPKQKSTRGGVWLQEMHFRFLAFAENHQIYGELLIWA